MGAEDTKPSPTACAPISPPTLAPRSVSEYNAPPGPSPPDSMNWYCKLIGHTYIYKSEQPKIRWYADKDMTELHMEAPEEGAPLRFLECVRCGDRVENPTPEQVKLTGSNAR